jgi:hypothetical protein
MRQRGRQSAVALSVVSPHAVLPGDRPDPPKDLTTEEAVEWRVIVQRLPTDWFPPETWPVLIQLCRHIITSRRISAELARVGRGKYSLRDPSVLKKFQDLSRLQLQYGQSVANLSTKLRITKQSQTDSRVASNQAHQSVRRHKPWETVDEVIDPKLSKLSPTDKQVAQIYGVNFVEPPSDDADDADEPFVDPLPNVEIEPS